MNVIVSCCRPHAALPGLQPSDGHPDHQPGVDPGLPRLPGGQPHHQPHLHPLPQHLRQEAALHERCHVHHRPGHALSSLHHEPAAPPHCQIHPGCADLLSLCLACNVSNVMFIFQFLGYGLFLTADSIVLVFTLGPEGSRPFMQALHFFVSIGFLTGTFLVQPFLPSKRELVCMLESKTNTTTDVTPSESNDEISNQPQEELVIPQLYGIQTICWPFIISGVWCTLVAIGYIVLTLRRSLVMPQFYDENTNTKHKEFGPKKLSYVWKRIFLALVLQFFAFSGALIRVFQSMSTTFSMCGPLQLETHR